MRRRLVRPATDAADTADTVDCEYVAGANWLGVALCALMHIDDDKRTLLRAEATRRILMECPENDVRRMILFECIERYLVLDPAQRMGYEQIIHTPRYQAMIPTMLTTREEGILEALRRTARKLLEKRFGPLSESVVQRLEAYTIERLEALIDVVLDVKSLKDLGLED